MRILEVEAFKDLRQLMRDIKVDADGIKIMMPKAIMRILRINSISNITANILKQEMLSLGGDVALARDVLTGRLRKTDCLLMGNLSQFNRLTEKLKLQPFGLNLLARELSRVLNNYQEDNFILNLNKYKLNLKKRTHIMGIVNLTPDSFSGDGLYPNGSTTSFDKLRTSPERSRGTLTIGTERSRSAKSQINSIIEHVENMVRDGTDIIDVGGESSRPGAKPVSVREETARTIPVIKILAKKIKAPISIDTYKPEVARQALDNGAVIVNDIAGLRNKKMLKVVAKYRAGVVIMHMKGVPLTMQNNLSYNSLIDEIIDYLDRAVTRAICAGIKRESIIIDPGLGFGKTFEHNLKILKCLREFKVLGRPILVGPSRKSFLGKILNVEPQDRIFGTVSACILAVRNGCHIVRVHDVKEVKQALKVLDTINNIK